MEREQFLEHYMEIQRPLRAYLLAATGNLHETDDLSQVVWQVLWRKLDQFDEARSFKAWSFGIARLELLKWRQGKARSREVLSEETLDRLADTSTNFADYLSARHAYLLDCIAELAGSSRRVVDMKYSEGRRSREIGELIKKSTEAVDMMQPQVRGSEMVIETPNSKVTVIGTRYRLATTVAEDVLEVEHGKVRLVEKQSGEEHIAETGSAYRVAGVEANKVSGTLIWRPAGWSPATKDAPQMPAKKYEVQRS